MLNVEEGPYRGSVATNDNGVRPMDELRVAGDVIAMGVTMRDDQCDRRLVLLAQPILNETVDARRNIHVASARIEQERTISTENQIQKGLLVVRARSLPHDDEIIVIRLHAKLRLVRAVGAAGVPVSVNTSSLELRAWLRSSCTSDDTQRCDCGQNTRGHERAPSANTRHGVIGISFTSTPSASATAFAIAGAVPMIGGSARPLAPV